MAKFTAQDLKRGVQVFMHITDLPVVLRDIPGDYGLVLFGPGADGDPEPVGDLTHSFETRDQLVFWMSGFIACWREDYK